VRSVVRECGLDASAAGLPPRPATESQQCFEFVA
jgi:hypothetical protein